MRAILLAAAFVSATPVYAGDPAHPTVVELYQSQGCSSCPPADANINALADRPDVLALNFAVTYWDQLGWKDTFAQPAFTRRQWEYANAGGRKQVATPQVIVDGRAVINGGNRAELERTIAAAHRSGPSLSAADGKLMIGGGHPASPATIWLVQYDPRTLAVPIRAGENGGRTLPHRNIVRSLQPLGTWTGQAIALPLAHPTDQNRRLAVLVQQGKGGPILAAARL